MTLEQAVQIVWRKYDRSIDYPTSGEEDFTLITGYLNDSIQAWGDKAHEDNIRWRELFTNLSSASTGTKTTTNGTSAYAAPSDFVEISSFVKVTDTDGNSVYHTFIPNDQVMANLKVDSTEKVFWVTYNATNAVYTINLSPTPTVTGNTIEYSYYKTPATLTNTTDVIHVAKPYFCVYHALAVLYEEERQDLAQLYSDKAVSLMNAMIIDNEMAPYNTSYKLKDIGYELQQEVFGK